MRPALRPGLLPLWRDRDTLQIGVDPRRAVAVSGMSRAAEVVRLLDGSRSREQVLDEAGRRGVPAADADRVLTVLAAAGALIDFPAAGLRSMSPELRRQLEPVLAVASLAGEDGDGGMTLLARRAATTVELRGSGPVVPMLADLLTRSGLAVRIAEDDPPSAAIRKGTAGAPTGRTADLTVLVGYRSVGVPAELLRPGRAHLAVSAGEAIGVVGPLVRPGISACLRCLDLARAGYDPAWPLILAQLTTRAPEPAACDPVLATAVAAQAAGQAVAFADRAPLADATVNGTLELALPAWQWRRRSWTPHPACICRSSDKELPG
jgi:hypothetical protein